VAKGHNKTQVGVTLSPLVINEQQKETFNKSNSQNHMELDEKNIQLDKRTQQEVPALCFPINPNLIVKTQSS
jgi:hypothetical protein